MSTTQDVDVEPRAELQSTWSYRVGAVSGLVATVVTGVVIVAVDVETLRVAIAGLYGFEGSLVAGWLAHLAHGTLFGVVFAAVISDPAFHEISEQRWKTALAGTGFGFALALGGTGILMPIWLDFIGVSGVDAIPYVSASSVAWHLLYGVVLGGLFATIERWKRSRSASSRAHTSNTT